MLDYVFLFWCAKIVFFCYGWDMRDNRTVISNDRGAKFCVSTLVYERRNKFCLYFPSRLRMINAVYIRILISIWMDIFSIYKRSQRRRSSISSTFSA